MNRYNRSKPYDKSDEDLLPSRRTRSRVVKRVKPREFESSNGSGSCIQQSQPVKKASRKRSRSGSDSSSPEVIADIYRGVTGRNDNRVNRKVNRSPVLASPEEASDDFEATETVTNEANQLSSNRKSKMRKLDETAKSRDSDDDYFADLFVACKKSSERRDAASQTDALDKARGKGSKVFCSQSTQVSVDDFLVTETQVSENSGEDEGCHNGKDDDQNDENEGNKADDEEDEGDSGLSEIDKSDSRCCIV